MLARALSPYGAIPIYMYVPPTVGLEVHYGDVFAGASRHVGRQLCRLLRLAIAGVVPPSANAI